MKHRLIPFVVSVVMVLGFAACGDDEPTPAPTSAPAPAPTSPATAPTVAKAEPTAAPSPAAPSDVDLLAQYAAEHAGGPGAIFVGDPNVAVKRFEVPRPMCI